MKPLICFSVRGQGERAGEEAILDEESIMKLAESLPPEDRSKALKLWVRLRSYLRG